MYDRAVKNFIKLVTKDLYNTQLNNYQVLLTFLINFDSNIKFSRHSYNNYKRRDTKFKPFITTNKINNLFKYIQKFDKDFNVDIINVNNPSKTPFNKSMPISHAKRKSISRTDKRCYTMSHTTQFFIIKPRLDCRYKSSYTYADIRRLKEADLVFDRSDYFLNTLDKKHELVPIFMPDMSEYKLKKEELSDAKKDVYGLSG